jgi:hypothetical protein
VPARLGDGTFSYELADARGVARVRLVVDGGAITATSRQR